MTASEPRREKAPSPLQLAADAIATRHGQRYYQALGRAYTALLRRRLTVAANRASRLGTGPLPDMEWTPQIVDGSLAGATGQASCLYPPEEVPAVLAAWAAALGLGPVFEPFRGSLDREGTFEGIEILVWGVVDREAYEARTDGTPNGPDTPERTP